MVAMIFVSLAVSWTPAEGTWPQQVSVPLINYIFTHRKRTDTGLVHIVHMPIYSPTWLVLINRPRRDGTLSWRWCTAVVGEIWTTTLWSQVQRCTTLPPVHREVSSLIEELCKLLPLLIDFIIHLGLVILWVLLLCGFVVSEADSQLQSVHPSPVNNSYTVYIVPEQCTFVEAESAVIGTLRSAFVSGSQGSVSTQHLAVNVLQKNKTNWLAERMTRNLQF